MQNSIIMCIVYIPTKGWIYTHMSTCTDDISRKLQKTLVTVVASGYGRMGETFHDEPFCIISAFPSVVYIAIQELI